MGENGNVEGMKLSVATLVKVVTLVVAIVGAYFAGQAAVETKMRVIANEVVSQRMEVFALRLTVLEKQQNAVEAKVDRLIDAWVDRGESPRTRR